MLASACLCVGRARETGSGTGVSLGQGSDDLTLVTYILNQTQYYLPAGSVPAE